MSAATQPAKDYSSMYGLNPPHSEVVAAVQTVPAGKALDLGSGSGRNALYLSQLGFEVTALDHNPGAIGTLQSIVEREQIDNLQARVYDMHEAQLGEQYDFIVCTVTLMFLDPLRLDAVVADMQHSTRPGGHNLIVAAMSTAAHPCPAPFPAPLAENQLREMYAGWELLKYNEDLGSLHSGAQMQFATMLARKPL